MILPRFRLSPYDPIDYLADALNASPRNSPERSFSRNVAHSTQKPERIRPSSPWKKWCARGRAEEPRLFLYTARYNPIARAHLDEPVHSSPIPRLINCETRTYTSVYSPSLAADFLMPDRDTKTSATAKRLSANASVKFTSYFNLD